MPDYQVGQRIQKSSTQWLPGDVKSAVRWQSTAVIVPRLYLEYVGRCGGLWYIPRKCSPLSPTLDWSCHFGH
jgi:hypothetical protein